MTVGAGIDAGHDARRDVVVFADQRLAVRLRSKITVAESAEGGELRTVVRLAELLTNCGRDEAQAEEFLN